MCWWNIFSKSLPDTLVKYRVFLTKYSDNRESLSEESCCFKSSTTTGDDESVCAWAEMNYYLTKKILSEQNVKKRGFEISNPRYN